MIRRRLAVFSCAALLFAVGVAGQFALARNGVTGSPVVGESFIAALGGLLGHDLGTPKVKARIGITNCPYEVIPKAMGVKKNMTYDLWLLSMTFTPA